MKKRSSRQYVKRTLARPSHRILRPGDGPHVISIDGDDTLFRPDGQPSTYAIEVLSALLERHYPVINTARRVEQIAEKFTGEAGSLSISTIGMHSAEMRLWDQAEQRFKEIGEPLSLTAKEVRQAVDVFRAATGREVYAAVDGGSGSGPKQHQPGFKWLYNTGLVVPYEGSGDLLEDNAYPGLLLKTFLYVDGISDPVALKAQYDAFISKFPEAVENVRWKALIAGKHIEVIHKDLGKARGLREFARSLDITRDRIVHLDDSEAGLEAFKISGHAVVMANGTVRFASQKGTRAVPAYGNATDGAAAWLDLNFLDGQVARDMRRKPRSSNIAHVPRARQQAPRNPGTQSQLVPKRPKRSF